MINRTCLQCNKSFWVYPSALKRGEGKHCNKKCYTISLKKIERPYRWKRINKSCLICSKQFEVRFCRIKQGSDKHCSKKCYGVSKLGQKMPSEFGLKVAVAKYGKKNIKIAGPQHYMWKGGITPLRRAIRSSFEYEHWHAKILARDHFACQICNTTKGPFNVDHFPKPFALIFHKNKIETIEQALACKDFWNLNNGRTLCKPCHHVTHY